MKKAPAISIGKTFLLIAIFQAFVITMAAVAVMAFTLPQRPPGRDLAKTSSIE